jgi:hypothetical protein
MNDENTIVADMSFHHARADAWLKKALTEIEFKDAVKVSALLAVIKRQGGNANSALAKMHDAMSRAGYEKFKNPDRADGRWEFSERRKTIVYIKSGIAIDWKTTWKLLD